jgi:D-alanyl-D-alanine carboxypeptidase
VTQIGSQIIGTTACLREGDSLSVFQLLYGMMLPSGNDAAYTLANFFGKMLYDEKYSQLKKDSYPVSWEFERTNTKYFLREMNECAADLKMYQSNYDSPHGLMNKTNLSTA